jgi:hypothetical protein
MEDNTQNIESFQIVDSAEALAASMGAPQEPVVEQVQEPTPEPIQEAPVAQPEPTPEPQEETIVEEPAMQDNTPEGPSYNESDIESAVMSFLSEKLGREINSIEDLSPVVEPSTPLDERVEAIAKFVQETGRSPQDWFTYQSLNPSEMDDMMAVRVNMATEYKDLNGQEIDLLLKSKYKLDNTLFTDDEIKLSQLQLKIDAAQARERITSLRESYRAPEVQQSQEPQSIVDDQWIANMRQTVQGIDGLEFSLGQDETFTFGLDDKYKAQLMDKNARLDEYFDPYIRDDGSWDIDSLSSHRALIDNIDVIAQSIYRKGLSDGQRGLVNKAANVSTTSPVQQNLNNNSDPVIEQIKQYFDTGTTTFKL